MDDGQRVSERVPAALGAELELIRGAVDLVASGGSTRVTLAGLRFGDELLEQARGLAAASGVRVVPQFAADEGGLDIVVETIADRA